MVGKGHVYGTIDQWFSKKMKEVWPITTILQNKIKELILSENFQVLWKFSKLQNPQLFYFASFQKSGNGLSLILNKKKNPRTRGSNKIKELPNTGIDYRPFGNREDRRSVPIGFTWLPCYAPSKAWVFQALFFQIMLNLNSTIIIHPIPPKVNLLMYQAYRDWLNNFALVPSHTMGDCPP